MNNQIGVKSLTVGKRHKRVLENVKKNPCANSLKSNIKKRSISTIKQVISKSSPRNQSGTHEEMFSFTKHRFLSRPAHSWTPTIPNMKKTKKQSSRTLPSMGNVSRSRVTRILIPVRELPLVKHLDRVWIEVKDQNNLTLKKKVF